MLRDELEKKKEEKSALMQFTVVIAFIFKRDAQEAKKKEKKKILGRRRGDLLWLQLIDITDSRLRSETRWTASLVINQKNAI